jgi:predicted RNA-binding Zn-ribbon protein involved in translation (DUF1610 family)
MFRYSPEGKRLVNRPLRIRPTPARGAALDGLAVKYNELEQDHDRLGRAERGLRGQLQDVDREIQNVRHAGHDGEARKLERQATDLRTRLSSVQGRQRSVKQEMEQVKAEAAGHHAVAQSLEMACPECGEAATPGRVAKAKGRKRGWYQCESCGQDWTATT